MLADQFGFIEPHLLPRRAGEVLALAGRGADLAPIPDAASLGAE